MSSRADGRSRLLIRRKPRASPWVSIGWRILLIIFLVLLVILLHWVERDGLRDNLDGDVSFVDVVYFTMVSITTTGYGDVVPVSDHTRAFDALLVTPLRVLFIFIFLGTAYQFVLRRTWENWVMAQIQKRLTDHIVVAGYGTSGSEAVAELISRGIDPNCIVVIDVNQKALQSAEALGCVVLQGDATRDTTLTAVRVDRARILLVSAGRDDTSILICLTARHVAPDLKITLAVRAEDNELLARQAGATTVINPVSFAGLLLAGSAEGSNIADYLADLASSRGRVQLSERVASAEEVGKPLSQIRTGLGVRIYRHDQPYGFWEPQCAALQPGDRIIEIISTEARERDFSGMIGKTNFTSPASDGA